jgi:hypothetical protein
MATSTDGSGSTSSSSGGSCSSTSGMAAGISNNPREAHVRLLLQPEVDQRRRQSARCLRLGTDTQCFFDERFKFPVSHDHLADKTLRFQVIIIIITLPSSAVPAGVFARCRMSLGRIQLLFSDASSKMEGVAEGRNYSILRVQRPLIVCIVRIATKCLELLRSFQTS